MAPQQHARLRKAGQALEQRLRIVDHHRVMPVAVYLHRVVMHRDQGVAAGRVRQGGLKQVQLAGGQVAGVGAGHRGVQRHDAPGADVGYRRRPLRQFLSQHGRLVVIARQAADLRAGQCLGLAQDGGKAPVRSRFPVLRQVARGHQQVGVLAVGLDLAQHGAQARIGIDAQHRGVGFAEQMAVGQLDEHGGRVLAPGQGMDAGQVPLLRSGYRLHITQKTGRGAYFLPDLGFSCFRLGRFAHTGLLHATAGRPPQAAVLGAAGYRRLSAGHHHSRARLGAQLDRRLPRFAGTLRDLV
ncbi:hypothetical protein G6F65_016642 [Rhizopus arrhizus]|nr:hypothetical protein G6F65_016642 [Rhizopus arrhizus]